ncbi:MAG TPA: TerC/Alx family metal homeostasis membrane protein [Cyclobacteriaceae bacterium]|nr:TerC/Alx family metal homeostasis membrane protein [Cyclobacteriaceae bacterium]HMV88089.1 TerC/Alx family metal homeostasis membrane protein [Cyclobacteriaceae bacterium]HMW98955.1 TerC/Alx family metal homeostasis membrane protein [Cyclobacteriaceae bacterium]HMX48411.1 TerC/Alx family metal homeostasis membrane protein [Cyclobacteriaceae bacterium]HMY95216.1 TerC/Alx family metal homeostasis membrane protein [Cyclobacteriaceae bacterium]
MLRTFDILLFSLFSGGQRETILFGIFLAVIIIFMVVDLGLFHKQAHKITTKSALYQSIFWVSISTLFGLLIYFGGPYAHLEGGVPSNLTGSDAAVLYFSTYLTEYALSVDNIFVILLILKYFKVDETFYHKILFWGILGAVIFRAIFIFVGAILIHKFHWILYIFGVFLIYSGIRIYFEDGDEKIEPEKNPILKICRRYLPISATDNGGKFFFTENGKWFFTPLFLVVVLIETTDLIFAVDSIPAAFAITQNEFLIYTSNIFAVMGLRAMFFLLAGIIDKFYLLQKGLSIILFFIGAKMLLEIFHIELNVYLSFTVIIATLTLSIIFSVLIPRKEKAEAE